MVLDPLVISFGLGVGVLVGLTGIGGGSLMTPLLILFAGVQPVVAIGTDLAYGAVTKTLGGWRHFKKGTVDLGVSKWLAVGSVPGSLLGVVTVNRLHAEYGKGFDEVLLIAIAVALVIVAVTTLTRAMFMPALVAREQHTVTLTGGVKGGAAAIGFVLGFLVGMTSVGSGALIGLALILVFRLTPHRVVGTDVFHAAILLWAAGIAHWISGSVDFVLMGNILIGSLPGVLIGTHLITKVPAAGLRPALGCVLIGSALGVLSKAGLEVPTWTIPGIPALTGLAAFLLHRARRPALAAARLTPPNDALPEPI
ncbi:MAG: sulfite exporter TauE/SafE family protein [Geodermatophilaceae bacterium]|nr:sulfite exporter TauE/SafE family protein [Geodermatophilaceae bacterium]